MVLNNDSMRRILFMTLALMTMMTATAKNLELKDVTCGKFAGETFGAVCPLADGETYAQLSKDGRQVVQYSFKTGKAIATLFDVATAKGVKLERIDGYLMSADGQRMLVQTKTEKIYRHSFSATYYIYSLRNNRLAPLSDNGPQQTPLFSPDGQQIAFVRDNNIFLVKLLYDNAEVQVTKNGKPGAKPQVASYAMGGISARGEYDDLLEKA